MSRQQNENIISLINSGGLFFIEGTKVHIIPLYRGDGRAPEVILPEGFTCRGTNPDLLAHVADGGRRSTYISTSRSKKVATLFAEQNAPGKKSFVYEINPQKTRIDVSQTLTADMLVHPSVFLAEEVAVPHKIAANDIKGVWILEENVSTGDVTKTFVKNPHYVAPLTRTAHALRTAGKAMTGVAIAADAMSLCYAFCDSQEAGNYERFFNEGARIAGGWSAAIAAGAACGQMGALWLAPFGPVASLAGGLAFGAIGSIAAYHVGGALAQNAETMISRMLREEKWVVNQFQTELKSAHNTMTEKLYAAENQRTLSVKPDDFYRTVYVPLPSKIPVFLESDSEAIVCKKLDGYFDDLIRGYPVSIQEHLRAMYYRNFNVISERGYAMREKRAAEVRGGNGNFFKASLSPWHEMVAEYQYNPQKYHPMIMDAEILCCPVLSRLYKMHEIAGHVGQMLQWEQQIGHNYFMGDQRETELFKQFLEQSVTILEKLLVDALPVSIIERDMMHMQSTAALKIKDKLLLDTIQKKSISLIDYVVHLERRRYQCDENYTRLFLNRPDIQEFLTKHTEALPNSQANRAPLANTQSQRSILPAHALMLEQKQKELAAAEAALAARRDLERQIAEKKAELAKVEQAVKAALAKSLTVYEIVDKSKKIADAAHQEYLEAKRVLDESSRIAEKKAELAKAEQAAKAALAKPLTVYEIVDKSKKIAEESKKRADAAHQEYLEAKRVFLEAANKKVEIKQKELAAAEAALAARRDLEPQLAEKLAEAKLAKEVAEKKSAEAELAKKAAQEKVEIKQKELEAVNKRVEINQKELAAADKKLAEANLVKKAAEKKSAEAKAALAAYVLKIMPTQLTAASSLPDAIVAIKNLIKNTELKKNENWLKYSKEYEAFEDYIFSKVGRRLPLLRNIVEAHPSISTPDEFYKVAQDYLAGDKDKKHRSADALRTAIELNRNHDNALCLLGVIAFNQNISTQETREAGIEYLRRAREKGNVAATAMMQKIEIMSPYTKYRYMSNIEARLLSGQLDVSQKDISHAGLAGGPASQGTTTSTDYDHHGEHYGDWGARGGSDMWGGGSTSGNGTQWDFVGTEACPSGEGTWDHYTSSDGSSMYTNLN